MADISRRITRKSLKAKKKAAIQTIKKQAKEKIQEVKQQYAQNPERRRLREEEAALKKERRLQKANAQLAYNERKSRTYTLGEEIFSSITHGIGAGLSAAAIVLLAIKAYFYHPAGIPVSTFMASVLVFGASLFIMYLMSTLYHALRPVVAKKVFSIFNHDAIYILIAGTYTPFIFALFPLKAAFSLASIVWAICGLLIVLYSVFGSRLRAFSVFTYIVFGWLILSVFVYAPITLNAVSRYLLLAGGLSYSVCGICYIFRRRKWSLSFFHLFALFGSILHFFSVYFMIG
ncbi:hemolysin III family protein [Treponema rectale]|uniref:Hemolysin III n=1 Tax=Treponema rectale TaxID=744512 RepID=A0A840SIP7_9SPIR|nr:hemolysin III family protein [Treponema rectale]MBB5219262.1 hemolysin III [Treponema rectale]QOS40853.1 hemolysin III family protein [Treponema rectale]